MPASIYDEFCFVYWFIPCIVIDPLQEPRIFFRDVRQKNRFWEYLVKFHLRFMPGMIKAPDFVGYFPLNPKGMSGAFNKLESSAEKRKTWL